MQTRSIIKTSAVALFTLSLTACGSLRTNDSGEPPEPINSLDVRQENPRGSTIWDAFRNRGNESDVSVNKYIWTASLEVLNFLPVQSVDPFTGVIVTGFGTPPGGGRAYRATVLINDPALDARSLNVALQTRGGSSANTATVRAIEDAILTRARQLRIADGRF
jgi:hypothetical protein